jgi:starvation-inducible DNA-binding protein
LAAAFTLFLKTKTCHWHMAGPHFFDYHLLLDAQNKQIFAATDPIAERVRKLGDTTFRAIARATRLQRAPGNEKVGVAPRAMLAGLFDDKQYFVARLREAHALCDRHGDVASARLTVNWIDDAKGSGENSMTPPLAWPNKVTHFTGARAGWVRQYT